MVMDKAVADIVALKVNKKEYLFRGFHFAPVAKKNTRFHTAPQPIQYPTLKEIQKIF